MTKNKMKYVKRYNKFNLQTNCRICLTQSVGTMIDIKTPLKPDIEPKLTILEALELVMSDCVDTDQKYPNTICAMCRELLKIAYDLKIQFKDSQEDLRKCFEDSYKQTKNICRNNSPVNEEKGASVEIIVGKQTFDIQNVFIVEDEIEEKRTFDGFLHNLGTCITASFVNKDHRPKLNIEPPHLVIEKISEKKLELEGDSIENEVFISTEAGINVEENEQIEEQMEDSDGINDFNNSVIYVEPVDEKHIEKFIIETENDKDILESALNMKYKCPVCGKLMLSLTKAKIHSQNCGKKKSAKCYVCGEQFLVRKDLLLHLKNAHVIEINKEKNNKTGKHECYICSQIFSSYGSLAYHLSKHQGKQYNCNICDKWFYTKNQVDIHKQIHNRDKTLVVCPICGKGFHYQSGLFYHMKMHTNERNYKCNYCPRSFYTRNSLKRHELTHTGARPYDCKFCDKKFRSLGEVKKHQFLHTGERPYQCKYCNMAFIQMHNLKVHLMTHPGDFQCIYCVKNFAEEEILKFHLQNKHQIKPTDQPHNSTEAYDIGFDEDGIEGTEQFETVNTEEGLLEGQVLEEEYFIMEEDFVGVEEGNMSDMIVKTYEVQNEVLVEALEDSL